MKEVAVTPLLKLRIDLHSVPHHICPLPQPLPAVYSHLVPLNVVGAVDCEVLSVVGLQLAQGATGVAYAAFGGGHVDVNRDDPLPLSPGESDLAPPASVENVKFSIVLDQVGVYLLQGSVRVEGRRVVQYLVSLGLLNGPNVVVNPEHPSGH
ncbi:MAG: hypothetical protein DRN40_01305 [Thermoplasmata archaeon]|nr:MAG: hypothetical protein DRN40_01305 [Thermoplasmata archaeon]